MVLFTLMYALADSGIENLSIENIVVFTNNNIRVDNRYPYINTCFLADLPHIIEKYTGETLYSDDDIRRMVASVTAAQCHEAYPMPIDMQQFKSDFATLLVTLEKAASGEVEESVDAPIQPAPVVTQVENVPAAAPVAKEAKIPAKRAPKRAGTGTKVAIGIGAALTAVSVIGTIIYKSTKR